MSNSICLFHTHSTLAILHLQKFFLFLISRTQLSYFILHEKAFESLPNSQKWQKFIYTKKVANILECDGERVWQVLGLWTSFSLNFVIKFHTFLHNLIKSLQYLHTYSQNWTVCPTILYLLSSNFDKFNAMQTSIFPPLSVCI